MTARHVVVIGGGLAGITAAIALQEAGVGVTLLEARPWLGGATCSFSRGELAIDNGQHIFLRCCTAYRELLARLGMTGSATLQDRFDVTVLSGGGPPGRPARRATLRRTALPGPLHMARALAGYSFLTPVERLRVGRAALAMRFADPAAPRLDGERLGDWLAARGQSEHARRMLWDLFIVSTLNINGDDANVALAATVIKTALLGGKAAADIGVPAVPLGDLHGRAAAALLGRLGADVRLGTKVTSLEPGTAGGFVVRTTAGTDSTARTDSSAADAAGPGRTAAGEATADAPDASVLRADGVVLAVPSGPAARLVPQAATSGAPRWAELGSSPIVNVHVIYDKRVTRLPLAAAVDSPVQWVFDKTRQAGVQAASTWRSRCRPPTATLTCRWRRYGSSSCRRSKSSSRPPGKLPLPISLSPENGGRRSARDQAADRSARVPRPCCRDWRSRAHGPIPAGQTRWRGPCEADTALHRH